MPRRRSHRILFALTLTLLASAVLASSALATVTASQITNPTDPTLLPLHIQGSEQTLEVSGTATTNDGNASDTVEIGCFYVSEGGPPNEKVLESLAGAPIQLTVQTDGTFTTAGLTGTQRASLASVTGEQPCTLRAVPPGTVPTENVTPFTGPRVGNAEYAPVFETAPNYYDDYLYTATLAGYWGWDTVSGCGPYGKLIAPETLRKSTVYTSDCEANLYTERDSASGASIVVGGHNAYATYSQHRIHKNAPGETYATLGAPVFDPATGNLSQTETEELVRCVAADGSAVDIVNPGEATCVRFVPVGVKVTRTVSTGQSGLQARVSDQFQSSDGSSHQITLAYAEEQGSGSGQPSYRFPGETAFGHLTPGGGAPALTSAPATFYYQSNPGASEPENGLANPRGAVTLASLPDATHVATSQAIELIYSNRTVPATGSLGFVQVLSQALTQSEADLLGASAEAQLAGPGVAISSPASGASVSTPAVKVTGTSSSPLGLDTVSVNGVAATVAGDGSWTATVPLSAGANTLTARATDPVGRSASKAIGVTYAVTPPPPPPPPSPPPATRAKLGGISAANGKVAFNLACTGTRGGRCIVHVTLTTIEKLRGRHLLGLAARSRTRTRRITLATATIILPAGSHARITLKLNAAGRRLLARFGKLPARLTATSRPVATAKAAAVLARNLTIRPPRRKHHRRR